MEESKGEIRATIPKASPRLIEYAAVFSMWSPKILMVVSPFTVVIELYYAGKMAETTTKAYAELAQSYIAHALMVFRSFLAKDPWEKGTDIKIISKKPD